MKISTFVLKKMKGKSMKKMNLREKRGITLVSLVVTIIILIILAAVSINLLFGENGILKISKDAKEDQNQARLLEKLELLKGPVLIEEYGVDLDSYLDELDNHIEDYQVNSIDRKEGADYAYVVLEGKYRFLVTDEKNGNVKITYEGLQADLLLSESSGTFIYPEKKTITVTNNVSGGALSVSSSNENIATATIEGETITIKSGKTVGTAIITVKSAPNGEYGENTTTYIAKVENATIEVTAEPYSGIYDGEAHGIKVTCNPSDAKIEYSEDGQNYSTINPTYTNVGKYIQHLSETKS